MGTPQPRSEVDTSSAVLRADGIEFGYGRLQVLFGVDLQVVRGEVLGLLGTKAATAAGPKLTRARWSQAVQQLGAPSSLASRVIGILFKELLGYCSEHRA